MAFEFAVGPVQTARSIEQIGQVIRHIGESRSYMGFVRRMATGPNGAGSYGAFPPQASDDPFASAREQPTWQVGYRWSNSITNSMGMTLNQGWQVVFEVVDEGTARSVQARVSGRSQKGEVEKFARTVLHSL